MIGNDGTKYLVKVYLPNLEKLRIGNYTFIQITAELEAKASNISQRGDGQISISLGRDIIKMKVNM